MVRPTESLIKPWGELLDSLTPQVTLEVNKISQPETILVDRISWWLIDEIHFFSNQESFS